ncbi:MAG: hypothetical protein HC848_00040 [Limnobacter sp.]|nr:hypothetical protein [Limnobacter sp.]
MAFRWGWGSGEQPVAGKPVFSVRGDVALRIELGPQFAKGVQHLLGQPVYIGLVVPKVVVLEQSQQADWNTSTLKPDVPLLSWTAQVPLAACLECPVLSPGELLTLADSAVGSVEVLVNVHLHSTPTGLHMVPELRCATSALVLKVSQRNALGFVRMHEHTLTEPALLESWRFFGG